MQKLSLLSIFLFLANLAYMQNVPIASPDSATGMAIIPIDVNVLQNDFDPDGDFIEIWKINNFGEGFYSFEDSIITYTSSPFTLGLDSIEYRIREVEDTTSISDWQKVYFTIDQNPDLPVCNNDYTSTKGGVPVVVDVLENDELNAYSNCEFKMVVYGTADGPSIKIDNKYIKFSPYNFCAKEVVIDYMIFCEDNPLARANGSLIVNVENSYSFDSLDINNIKAGVNSSGNLFCMMGDEIYPKFEFPAGSNKHTIFTINYWIGGTDENDSLHLAGERYNSLGRDFQNGPVSDDYDSLYIDHWLRLWKLSRAEVEYHILNWNQSGYEPIDAIKDWPGNGNVENGQAEQLAPYFDLNNDNLYKPEEGDYPLIRGDQSIFFIVNDDCIHTETQGKKIGLELHGMVYGFEALRNPDLSNTIFVHFDLINRSEYTYTNTFFGMFADLDIGYAWDDYVGSNVELGSLYAFNGEEIDGNGEAGSYGENPPVQSVTVLAGPFMDADQEDNPDGGCDYSINGMNFGNGIIDDERFGLTRFVYFNNSNNVNGNPVDAADYYKLLSGYWKDGSQIVFGGNGHLNFGGVGPACRFMFPGDTDPCNWGTNGVMPNGGYNQNGKFWTEMEVGNSPSDKRGVCVTGPFTFEPGEVQEIEIAFVAEENAGTPEETINKLFYRLEELFTMIENGEIIVPNASLGSNDNPVKVKSLELFPVPAGERIKIRSKGLKSGTYFYKIYNMFGQCVVSGEVFMDGIVGIDLSSLEQGVYTLNLFNKSCSFTEKFIKSH